jgi:hypothetical protein
MFIAALFIMAKRKKQTEYPSIYEGINKICHVRVNGDIFCLQKGYNMDEH